MDTSAFTAKWGPLPVWLWAVLAAGVVVLYLYLTGKGPFAASSSNVAADSTGGASSADLAALLQALQSLPNQGTGGGNGINPAPVGGGGVPTPAPGGLTGPTTSGLPPTFWRDPINGAIFLVDSLGKQYLGPSQWAAIQASFGGNAPYTNVDPNQLIALPDIGTPGPDAYVGASTPTGTAPVSLRRGFYGPGGSGSVAANTVAPTGASMWTASSPTGARVA